MRTLYLLRHANATPAVEGDFDFDRPLSEEGLAQCARLAEHMGDIRFDKALCSPARRTSETLRNAARASLIEMHEEFYNAVQAVLLRAIHGTSDSYDTLLVVAHNPGISDLARSFGLTLVKSMPPCGFASFTVEGSWREASAETCRFLDLYCP